MTRSEIIVTLMWVACSLLESLGAWGLRALPALKGARVGPGTMSIFEFTVWTWPTMRYFNQSAASFSGSPGAGLGRVPSLD